MISNTGFIYLIKNKNISDCVYIGHTKKHVKLRFSYHIINAYGNKKSKQKYAKLYIFMKKYDPEDFDYEILEKVEYIEKKELRIKEDAYITLYNSIENGLNKNRAYLTDEEIKEYAKKYYIKNKENFKNYYIVNKEHFKEYYIVNKEKILQNAKLMYHKKVLNN